MKYQKEYINEKIDWIRELTLLTEIAAFAPQEAYTCFTSGYRHKLNFCMRTIPSTSEDFKQLQEVVSTKFIPLLLVEYNRTTWKRSWKIIQSRDLEWRHSFPAQNLSFRNEKVCSLENFHWRVVLKNGVSFWISIFQSSEISIFVMPIYGKNWLTS